MDHENLLAMKLSEAAEKDHEREEQRRLGREQRARVAASLARSNREPNPHGNHNHGPQAA